MFSPTLTCIWIPQDLVETQSFFKKKIIFNWRIIALQYCVGFCYLPTWVGHRYTYVPSLLNLLPTSHRIPPFYIVTERWMQILNWQDWGRTWDLHFSLAPSECWWWPTLEVTRMQCMCIRNVPSATKCSNFHLAATVSPLLCSHRAHRAFCHISNGQLPMLKSNYLCPCDPFIRPNATPGLAVEKWVNKKNIPGYQAQ